MREHRGGQRKGTVQQSSGKEKCGVFCCARVVGTQVWRPQFPLLSSGLVGVPVQRASLGVFPSFSTHPPPASVTVTGSGLIRG